MQFLFGNHSECLWIDNSSLYQDLHLQIEYGVLSNGSLEGGLCKVWNMVSSKCRAWSPQSVKLSLRVHGSRLVHKVWSRVCISAKVGLRTLSPQSSKIALLSLSTECRAWFHNVWKVVSAVCGALQSVMVALQNEGLVKIALFGFRTITVCLEINLQSVYPSIANLTLRGWA